MNKGGGVYLKYRKDPVGLQILERLDVIALGHAGPTPREAIHLHPILLYALLFSPPLHGPRVPAILGVSSVVSRPPTKVTFHL